MFANCCLLLSLLATSLSPVVSDDSCYDLDGSISGLAHTCVCDESKFPGICSQSGCEREGGIWTPGCNNCHCDGSVGSDVGEGCFFAEPHTCDCDPSLCSPSSCENGGGEWTNVCSSCVCEGGGGQNGEAGAASTFCFSEWTTVEILRNAADGAIATTMRDLRVGDRVKTATGKFEPVYAFGHFHDKQSAEFLRIQTNSVLSNSLSSPLSYGILEVTKDHLIFVDGTKGPVKAGSISVGDVLLLHSSSGNYTSGTDRNHIPAIVTDISTVERNGLYAPLTPSGTIVVNGIVASTYAAISNKSTSENVEIAGYSFFGLNQADAIHLTLTPLRIMCTTTSFFGASCKDLDEETKMQKYVAWGISTVHWGEEQSIAVQLILSVIALLVSTSMYIFERILCCESIVKLLLIGVTTFGVYSGYSSEKVDN